MRHLSKTLTVVYLQYCKRVYARNNNNKLSARSAFTICLAVGATWTRISRGTKKFWNDQSLSCKALQERWNLIINSDWSLQRKARIHCWSIHRNCFWWLLTIDCCHGLSIISFFCCSSCWSLASIAIRKHHFAYIFIEYIINKQLHWNNHTISCGIMFTIMEAIVIVRSVQHRCLMTRARWQKPRFIGVNGEVGEEKRIAS